MAPQSGRVSNFCGTTGTVIEPFNAGCFQKDRGGTSIIVHNTPPAWTHLELAALAECTAGSMISPDRPLDPAAPAGGSARTAYSCLKNSRS